MAKETKKVKIQTKKVKIQWYRSAIAAPEKHKVIVRSLGLTRLNQVVERPDTPAIRGMVAKIPHLLRIVE
jgi:large subunit ribosomal protein L30